MAVQRIIIETSATNEAETAFRADVVQGPKWAKEWAATSPSSIGAYMELTRRLMDERPRTKFEFIHTQYEG